MNCTNLKEFVYEGSELKSIQNKAFFNCSSLKRIELLRMESSNQKLQLDDSLNNEIYSFSIGNQAFMNCTSLTEIIIENNSINQGENNSPSTKPNNKIYSRIKECAFYNCKCLEKARFLLENLECIEQKAFYNCSSLKVIELNAINWNGSNIRDHCCNDAFEETPDDFGIRLIKNGENEEDVFVDSTKLKFKTFKSEEQK